MVDVLRDEMQLLAEVGQPGGDGVQLGRAASGAVGATPLGGGFEYLVQAGHRAEVLRDGLVEQVGEFLGSGCGEAVVPGSGRCAAVRTRGRADRWLALERGGVLDSTELETRDEPGP
ncbi:hypothetical protein ACFQ0G_38775 [Streptomyces chiangmaiensis]